MHLSFIFFCSNYVEPQDDAIIEHISKTTHYGTDIVKEAWQKCIANGKVFVYSECDKKLYWCEIPAEEDADDH